MTSTQLLNAQFVQVPAETQLVTIPGQAQSQSASLGNILAGKAPSSVPVTGITAHAGGGQSAATQLVGGFNRVDTVVTAADSVKLPLAVAGLEIYVINNTSTSMQVYGAGTDTINSVATATGVAQASQVAALYICSNSAPAGIWHRIQSS